VDEVKVKVYTMDDKNIKLKVKPSTTLSDFMSRLGKHPQIGNSHVKRLIFAGKTRS